MADASRTIALWIPIPMLAGPQCCSQQALIFSPIAPFVTDLLLTLMIKTSSKFHEDLSRDHERGLTSDRTFGLVLGAAFMIVGVFPVSHGNLPRLWAIVIGGAFLILALAVPRVLHRANVYWSKLGLLLNRIVSPVVMALLFFAVVTPVALIFRRLGNDPLRLKLDPTAATYWIDRVPPGPSPESIKDQF